MHEVDDAATDAAVLLAALRAEGCFYLAAPDGRLLESAEGYARTFGVSASERRLADPHRAAVLQVAATEGTLEGRETALDAERRPLRGEHRPVRDAAGNLVAVLGRFREVGREQRLQQALAEERQRFHDINRAHSDWIWETDGEARLRFLSDRAAAILGTPPELLRGRTFADVLGEGPHSALAEAMRQRRPFRGIVAELRGDGDARHALEVSGVPWFETSGRFGGFRGTCHDVTERRGAERALAEAHAALQRSHAELAERNDELDQALLRANAATRAKDIFLASMSHELRTPLNAILGMAEIMQLGLFGPLSERYADYAQDMMTAGRHLLRLVDDVLDTARIEADSLPLRTEAVDLPELLHDARKLVERRAAERGIVLSQVDGGQGCTLLVDRTRALQILTNLLANAVKFTLSGGEVGIEVGRRTGKDDQVEIVVWDNGPGVPPDMRDGVFEPFNRGGRDVMNEPTEGAGLGLALARKLARLMGGDLKLAPAPGRGGRFVVRLPLAEAPSSAAPPVRLARGR